MKYLFTFAIALLGMSVIQAQSAESILNELSEKAKKYKSVEATYSSKLIDKASNFQNTSQGKISMQGDSYNLDTGDYLLISDGNNLWTYQKEYNEVNVDLIEDLGEDGFSPNKLFTIWENDFKSELKGVKNIDGIDCYEIHLFPNKAEDRTFHTVKMFVEKSKMEVYKLEVKGREGTDVIYKILTFKPNAVVDPSKFTFKEIDFPGVDIIDNR